MITRTPEWKGPGRPLRPPRAGLQICVRHASGILWHGIRNPCLTQMYCTMCAGSSGGSAVQMIPLTYYDGSATGGSCT